MSLQREENSFTEILVPAATTSVKRLHFNEKGVETTPHLTALLSHERMRSISLRKQTDNYYTCDRNAN